MRSDVSARGRPVVGADAPALEEVRLEPFELPGLALDAVLGALGRAFGGRKAEMADPKDAERSTGYVVGGIAPVGQKRRLPTVVDESAAAYDVVYVSAGRRGLDLGIAPADLVAVTGAITADVSRS